MDRALINAIDELIVDLAAKRYAQIVQDGRGGRLSEEEIKTAISEYGRTLVRLPDEAWDLVDTFDQTGSSKSLAVDVPLWTVEEGRSDLTLSLTASKIDSAFRLEIDDIHVL